MTQPNHKKPAAADESVESRKRSGMRRIDDASDVGSVPRAPRLPSLDWPVEQDHIPTQPENEVPSSALPTLRAPSSAPPASDDVERDTIPSPAPEAG